MGTGDSGLRLPTTNQSQGISLSSAEYTHSFDDSDESRSDGHVNWSPGDGVCPTTAQFNHCCQSKIDDWKNAACTHLANTKTFHDYLTAFLGLLEDVPQFYCNPPEAVNVSGRPGSFLVLQSSLEVKTTEVSNCDQSQKSIDYLQCLGSPAPATYRTKAETQPEATIPVYAKSFCSGYFTSIVLAWSYIISCRWVEILQQAGEDSQILHERGMQIKDAFWDIVTQGRWVARVKTRKGVYYSPWMLRREGTINKGDDWKLVTSNSFLAFETLQGFCVLERMEEEFLTGLTSVLIMTSRHVPPPRFAPPMVISTAPMRSLPRPKNMILLEMFRSIDKCMSLSSTQDAMDSLLCSAFFDPCVPCNLMGAASLGVRKALSIADEIDNRQLLSAIANKRPHLSLLWAAAVCNDQVTPFLNMALCSLPPICLVAAFWTNTAQSFLQIKYRVMDSNSSMISRADEFKTSYFCRPNLSVPWSPAPPFGTTPVRNLSLEVRAHLAHVHRPISWRIYWNLDSGGRVPSSEQHQLRLIEAHSICHSCSPSHTNELPYPERDIADEQSGVATSRLFNWHRSYDDGIWLDDGQGDIEFVRRLQVHPWIIDQFDSQEDEPVEKPKHRDLCVDRILRWNSEVEEYKQAGVDTP
ncbi:hypothetical protein BDV36DRAFT_302996 [Aspergillus pseudocaelatus]|uniref:Uncharacterized protein n=1 Tax=Aspergillus pseudocaelatus TaxID=1825620 RepID=A0ABQ6VZ53_9EURO|nr:hypothetical protein BDV36DRAFT_302996 [Aspergillus pseudocaelatus]